MDIEDATGAAYIVMEGDTDTADMNSWMDIQDATDAAYMVTAGDEGYRATTCG
jgi:hypothetical protein